MPICMRGKRAARLALHKSKFEYARGRPSPMPVRRRPFILDHTSVRLSPRSGAPVARVLSDLGREPATRQLHNQPGRERRIGRKEGRKEEEGKNEIHTRVEGEEEERRSKKEPHCPGRSARIGRRMCGPSTNAKSSLSLASGFPLCATPFDRPTTPRRSYPPLMNSYDTVDTRWRLG